MRYSTLLAAALLCVSVSAQNEITNFPRATNFTSRGSNATSLGEILMGYHKANWRGIGQWLPVKTEINKLWAVVQDQDVSTQEKYNWVIRKGTDAKGPTVGKAGEIYVSATLTSPPRTGTIAAFAITHILKTPISIPPTSFFAMGIRLSAAPKWTKDGLSCHMASGTKTSAGASGAEAGTQQVDQAWDILLNAKAATHPSMKRCWRMSIFVKNPAFQVGNVFKSGNNYGPGGLFPDMIAKPAQGLAMRVRAAGTNGQVAMVFFAADFFPATLPIFFGTRFYLHPTTLSPIGLNLGVVAADKAEAVTIPVIPSFLAKKKVAFQALLIDAKTLKLTLSNAVLTQF